MKKNLFLIFGLFTLISCSNKLPPRTVENEDGSVSITRIDEDSKAVKYGKKIDGYENVTVIDCSKISKNTPASISLNDYANKDLYIQFTCDMKITDKTGEENKIIWMINEVDENFPQLYKGNFASGKWVSIKKDIFVHVGKNRQLYISGQKISPENLTIYLKNFDLRISGDGIGSNKTPQVSWLDAPSLKETYEKYFDYFGLTIPYNDNTKADICKKGVQRHATCITMENEFKPDFIFGWNKVTKLADFKAEDGKFYKVPANIPTFAQMDNILQDAKTLGLKMRGHVLVWHSQTPDWFFRKNYAINGEKDFVTPAEMNARQEWYIKSVLEHVKIWEKENNNGEHIIFAWDVVNEAASDNASDAVWLRTGDSKWYSIYQNDRFIVNAFRYANKYAPKDVKLVYNDYGCTSYAKNKAICKIIDAVQSAPDARIDAVGMQTHVGMDTKVTGGGSFEEAVKKFTAKGLNVQITEMDISIGTAAYSPIRMKAKYKEFFEMFLANRKTAEKKGIEGITLWGTRDEWTWLNSQSSNKGNIQHPLLFQGKDFNCKPSFYGVMEAVQSVQE